VNGDTVKGMAAWGNVSDGVMDRGIPLPGDQALTGCSYSLKYSIDVSTPGFIAFIPKKNGADAGAGNGFFPGAYVYTVSGNQLSFQNYTQIFSPALSVNPDSCIVVVSSADMISADAGTPGDYLIIDNLAWNGTTNIFPNGNLELWQDKPAVDLPVDWNVDISSSGSNLFEKSTESYGGLYALKLKNKVQNQSSAKIGRANLGFWSCPNNNGPCEQIPGMKIDQTPRSFGFHYKYTSPGIDTATFSVSLMEGGTNLTGSSEDLLLTNDWLFRATNFATPLSEPDSIFISFSAGKWSSAVEGSELLIDNLQLHYCNDSSLIQGPTSVCENSDGVAFSIQNDFASSYIWSTNTGSINGTNFNNEIVVDNVAAAGEISVQVFFSDGCPDTTFTFSLAVSSSSSANAGVDLSMCSTTSSIAIIGSVSGASGGIWSSAGTGTFGNPALLSTTYSPSEADIAAGTVSLTLTPTGVGGCVVTTDDLLLTILTAPTVVANLLGFTEICAGDQITVYGSGADEYTWNNGVTDNVLFAPVAGTNDYIITGTNSTTGCTNKDTITIIVNQLPYISAGFDQVVCEGAAVTLNGSSNASFSWNNGAIDAVSFVPLVGTVTYMATSTNAQGCTNFDETEVTVHPLPTVSAGNDLAICEGNEITLAGAGTDVYQWDNGVTDNVPFIPSLGEITFTVIGTDGNGCSAADEVTIIVSSFASFQVGADTSICLGSAVELNASGGVSYTWDNGIGDANPVEITPATTTTYTVTGLDAIGCEGTGEITITVNPLPLVIAGLNLSVCEGSSITLSGSGASIYNWDNGVVDDEFFVPLLGTTVFTVVGTDDNNCVNTDELVVIVHPNPSVSLDLDANDSLCVNTAAVILEGGFPTGGTYYLNSAAVSEFNPSEVGVFTVEYSYTDSENCTAIASSEIVVDSCQASTLAEINEMGWVVSPNPTAGIFTVQGSNNNVGYALVILDVTGKIIYEEQTSKSTTMINLSNYSNGMYIVKVKTDLHTKTFQLVLNK
jgi:hypothetical protein